MSIFEGSYQMLINGELVDADGGVSFDVINPSSGKTMASAPSASASQTQATIKAAKDAYASWSLNSIEERRAYMAKAAEAMEANKDELAKLLVQEQGKPLASAQGELYICIECLKTMSQLENPVETRTVDFAPASEAHTVQIRRVPIGVVACITPWNFPMFCSVQKWAPAIVLGNTCVLKPSPFTPLTALRYGKILQSIFPPGVLNIISGDDKAAFNVGACLSAHSDVNKVSFTGSVPTGKKIMACAASDVKRITLEMGGNDAAIVRQDIDIKAMAPKIFEGAFGNTGQVCCAIKRCFVHESIVDAFTAEMAKCAEAAKVASGDGFAEGVKYGPLNNKMQFDKVSDLVEDAKANGAVIHAGGKAMTMTGDTEGGYFYEPTIISGVAEGVRIVDEEQFGPALPILSYKTEKEALMRANATEYGLGGSVWSADANAANELAAKLQAGTVWVNDHMSLTGAPFGGFKSSGLGRELGIADLSTFTECQTLTLEK
jgi:acyl-CoA reductase-like NAD-dependent aldehyde dehydrogenase